MLPYKYLPTYVINKAPCQLLLKMKTILKRFPMTTYCSIPAFSNHTHRSFNYFIWWIFFSEANEVCLGCEIKKVGGGCQKVVLMKNILANNCYFRGTRWDNKHVLKAMVFFILTMLRLLSYSRNFCKFRGFKKMTG